MFANELLLKNDSGAEREYRVEKADRDSVGVEEVSADGHPVQQQNNGVSVVFTCTVPSGKEVFIRVRYTQPETKNGCRKSRRGSVKVAIRRYLSEFRDNFLSRHDGLMAVAKRAKTIVSRR
jgi:hypothetical protein